MRARNSQRSVGNTKDDPDKDAIKTSGCGRTDAHVLILLHTGWNTEPPKSPGHLSQGACYYL